MRPLRLPMCAEPRRKLSWVPTPSAASECGVPHSPIAGAPTTHVALSGIIAGRRLALGASPLPLNPPPASAAAAEASKAAAAAAALPGCSTVVLHSIRDS